MYDFAAGKLLKVVDVPEDVSCDIADFYDEIARLAGLETRNQFDCREIVVSQELQDMIIKYYEEQGSTRAGVAQLLLFYGPKVCKDLSGCKAAISDRFVC